LGWLGQKEKEMTTRKLVPLKPDEKRPEILSSVPIPEGFRLETDAEMRNRILSAQDRKYGGQAHYDPFDFD
jgi:hypothetical protein